MKPLAFAFLAGLISALGFEPVGFWPLTVFAFAALLWLVERAPRLRSALARGWWFGFGQFVLGLNWIATAFTYQAAMPAWLGWVAVVLLSLYLAVYPAAAAGLAWRWSLFPLPSGERDSAASAARGKGTTDRRTTARIHNRLVLVLLLAAAWIVTEYLRAVVFTGFAWNPVGVALLDSGLAAPAIWIGTYGVSGLLVLFAGAFFLAVRGGVERRPAAILLLAAFASAGAAWLFAPTIDSPYKPGPAVRIVQPNIGQEQKWSPEFAARNMARLGELSRTDRPGPRLLIWPEAAVTEPLQDGRRLLGYQHEVLAIRRQVQSMLAPGDLLLTGGITVGSDDGMSASRATNSVFAMTAGGRILGRYDKAHLVPYGEYLPMRPILSALGLSRLAPGDLDFDPGPGAQTLDIPGIGPVGFQLCYEIIFSGEVVDPARRPGFIFNPSNDAWFGAWGPPQHLAQARLRALEEGLPVLRATPTGISAIIDARGRLLRSIPHGEMGVIDDYLPVAEYPTLFASFGNALPFAFALVLVIAAIIARRRAA